jgi:hypothetical protein
MKISSKVGSGILTAFGIFAAFNTAQSAEHTLSEFQLGENISGTEVKLDKLEGKVVVIEYWGTR